MRAAQLARVALIALALTVTGCATESGTGTTEQPAAGSNAEATDDGTSDEAADEPTQSENPKFGDTYTWEDGLQVTISKPKPFEPSEFAAAEKAAAYVAFNVTIVNGTDANYDPTLFSTTMQSGNEEAAEVFDTENGFEGSPLTAVLPGRESKFKIGYGVSKPDDLVMDVSPGFEYESVIFTN
jgi:predicted small secreted protein